MIKAPFRFDVEYFSIVVVFRQVLEEDRHYFRSQKEKDLFIVKAKNNELIPAKQLKMLQTRNYYMKTAPKQLLYFIVQNKKTSQFLASVNKTQELQIEVKAVFADVSSLYSYIRNNCDSDIIKMTRKGNLIIDYFINQTIYQLKIDNYPTSLSATDIEQIWKQLKFNWDNRKETTSDSSQKYFRVISKSGLAGQKMKKGYQVSESRQYQRQMNEPYVQQVGRFPYRQSNKEPQYVKTPESKPPKQHKVSSKYSHKRKRQKFVRSSSESASMSPQQRLIKTKRYEVNREYEESGKLDRQTPKQLMVSNYDPKKWMNYSEEFHGFASKESQQQNKKLASLQSKSSFQQSLKRIQYKINQLKKQNVKQEIIDGITQYFGYKFDKFMETVMQQILKQNASINRVIDSLPKNTAFTLKFADQITQRAYKLFYQQKQHIFVQEMRLPLAVARQNIQRLWVQIGSDGQMNYKERVLVERSIKKKTKKSTKKEQLRSSIEGNSNKLREQSKDKMKIQKCKMTEGFKNEQKVEHQEQVIIQEYASMGESEFQKNQ